MDGRGTDPAGSATSFTAAAWLRSMSSFGVFPPFCFSVSIKMVKLW